MINPETNTSAESATTPAAPAPAAPAAAHPTQPAPANTHIILASASPRRFKLLADAGVKFTVRTPKVPVDETLTPDEAANPEEAAKKLAQMKAGAVLQELIAENPLGTYIIIGADTMVVLDGEIFGKPQFASDATRMLNALSGKTHDVITAVSVWMLMSRGGDDVSVAYRTFADTSHVTFKNLTDAEITAYIQKGESFDKAGAYAIQGEGEVLVEHYTGSLDTIIGLPAARLIKEFPDLLS